jgi:putative endonuclease
VAPHLQGAAAERAAETYLRAQGLRTVQRNFRCKVGEIDLVMEHGGALVFVEVRYRASAAFGDALESISPHKQQRVIRAAAVFLQQHVRYRDWPCRFDAIGLAGIPPAFDIRWIKSAFSA